MQVSPSWKIDSLGVSADDFINRSSDVAPHAFMGRMWRFAHDTDARKAMEVTVDGKPTPPASNLKSLDNFLVDEAKKKGLPIPQSDTGTPEQQAAAQADHQRLIDAGAAQASYTSDQLEAMPKQQIADIAAATGVANLNQGKQKLIEAILDRQS